MAGTLTEAQTLNRILREVEELKADKQQDEQKIQNLEQKVDEIQGQNKQLKEANQKLQTDTGTKIEALQTKVDAPVASSEFGNAFDRYLGSHTFSVTGAAAGNFVYNQQNAALDGLHHHQEGFEIACRSDAYLHQIIPGPGHVMALQDPSHLGDAIEKDRLRLRAVPADIDEGE